MATAASSAAFGLCERREEAVAGLLNDLAAAVGDLLLEQLVVPGEQLLPLLVAERLQSSRVEPTMSMNTNVRRVC